MKFYGKTLSFICKKLGSNLKELPGNKNSNNKKMQRHSLSGVVVLSGILLLFFRFKHIDSIVSE